MLGYLCHNYGSVVEFESWNGFCLEGIVRGIGEISGGATIFSVVEFLKESNADNPGVKRKSREGLVTVLKVTCYIVVFAFAITGSKARYNYTLHAYLFCVLGIIASFLDAGFRIKDSAVTRYLGRISVPIYIFHGVLRWSFKDLLGNTISSPVFFCLILVCIVLSIAFMYFSDYAFNLIRRKKDLTIPDINHS